MLDGRLLFSSWTLVDSEMGIVSQALGSFHLMFCSLPDCQVKCAGQLCTYSHQVFLPPVISETGKKKKLHAPLFVMCRKRTSNKTEHMGLPHFFPYYLTSSCRPANWERELAPHSRQPDVLPDGGQRGRGFRISSRKSPHYRSTRW